MFAAGLGLLILGGISLAGTLIRLDTVLANDLAYDSTYLGLSFGLPIAGIVLLILSRRRTK